MTLTEQKSQSRQTKKMETYYKVTRADGHSYYDSDTVYKVGITISKPVCQEPVICTNQVLHASRNAIDALKYGKINDLKLFRVRGQEVVSQEDKSGFFELKVFSEIPESGWDKVFGFGISEARAPINPMKIQTTLTDEDWKLVDEWDSVWASVRDSVGAYIGSLFPKIKKWKYIENKSEKYPFDSANKLWRKGLIPVYYQESWKLISFKDGKVIINEKKVS